MKEQNFMPSATVTQSQALYLAQQMVEVGAPCLFAGPAGIGKTEIGIQAAEAANTKVVVSHPVTQQPIDYAGMATKVVNKEGETEVKPLPIGIQKLLITATEPITLIIDDIGHALQSTQAAIMHLVHARMVCEQEISPHVRFILTTNRISDVGAGANPLLTPLLDRMAAVWEVKFNLNDWVAHCIQHRMPESLIAFARFQPKLIMDTVTTKKEDRGDIAKRGLPEKHPTPRSVFKLGMMINAGIESDALIAGACGNAFAIEYKTFRAMRETLPNIDGILSDNTTHESAIMQLTKSPTSVKFAVFTSLAIRCKEHQLPNLITFADLFPSNEMKALLMRDILASRHDLLATNAFREWIVKPENKEIISE